MSGEFYAISESGYRAIEKGAPLLPGEQQVTQIPDVLLVRIRADQMRTERSRRLRATDWTQMADASLTALEKAAYQTYRQALRDLPSLPGFPDVPWPTLPTIRDGTASSGEGAVYP
ncbi:MULTISPECIES: tail fiber assembly protein [Stenotrophomonas maltophilia group]|uniref:Phage tail assembly chaperone-like domain-containing protein n=1 Tax=Stenotrophomonas maltophilia TaxID=40324 RepID=A0A246I515_STEMA|nr:MULTISPECIES: tail fiber assembly protein [Stenotrophomonas maltophilia group]MCZ7845264.1 phage tail assembly chaperone [Stenotrophomonas maltophilia]MDJ1626964.1 tail fiber assembly protein [Stenotrophomonas sepilia]OWQ73440.1 hypothetical protein CEE63_12400 [Stenotrophomonas maltophilia]PZT40240.1 hypothetical protein A7X97_04820 [Stenotrophomonas sepilia]